MHGFIPWCERSSRPSASSRRPCANNTAEIFSEVPSPWETRGAFSCCLNLKVNPAASPTPPPPNTPPKKRSKKKHKTRGKELWRRSRTGLPILGPPVERLELIRVLGARPKSEQGTGSHCRHPNRASGTHKTESHGMAPKVRARGANPKGTSHVKVQHWNV